MENYISSSSTYDTPRTTTPPSYDAPRNVFQDTLYRNNSASHLKLVDSNSQDMHELYDVPQAVGAAIERKALATASYPQVFPTASETSRWSNKDHHLLEYDVPRDIPIAAKDTNCYAFKIKDSDAFDPSLKSATQKNATQLVDEEISVELVSKLECDIITTINDFLSYMLPNLSVLSETDLVSIKIAAFKFQKVFHEFTKYIIGIFSRTLKVENSWFATEFHPHVNTLINADYRIKQLVASLETRDKVITDDSSETIPLCKLDILMKLWSHAQKLKADINSTSSFIQRHSSLAFTENGVPINKIMGSTVTDNNEASSKDEEIYENNRRSETAMGNYYATLQFKHDKNSSKLNTTERKETLCLEQPNKLKETDPDLMQLFTEDMKYHLSILNQAIIHFLNAIEKNQPPRIFIAHGKFVLICSFNLVSSGEIFSRRIQSLEKYGLFYNYIESLRSAIQNFVKKSRIATTQFPRVTAVQEMVNCVSEISMIERTIDQFLTKS